MPAAYDETSPSPADLLPDTIASEWPPYEITPFAYHIINGQSDHLTIVMTREHSHAFQKNSSDDPRHHTIYAIYADETEKLIQFSAATLGNTKSESFENDWRTLMESMQIEPTDIDITLKFYREHPPT